MMIADLSVEFPPNESASMQTHLANLGFEVVFSNVNVSSKQAPPQVLNQIQSVAERVSKLPVPLPEYVQLPGKCNSLVNHLLGRTSATSTRSLHVLTRVTLVLQPHDKLADLVASDNSLISFLRNAVQVDCFAIKPASESQFVELILNKSKYGFDLVSIDVASGYFLTQQGAMTKTLKSVHKDLHIELELSQCFRTSTGSGSEVSNTVNQCRVFLKRMQGIVVSSGAKNSLGIRSSVDLVNWGENILGLRNVQTNISEFVETILKKRLVRSNFP